MQAPTASPTNPISNSTPLPQTGRVLLVEDDQSNREGLTQVLTMEGLNVAAFESVESVPLELVAQRDLMILDYHLSGMNGLDFLINLRSGGSKIPVIMMSADGRLKTSALASGAIEFFEKPFDIRAFLSSIQSIVQ